MLVGNSERQLIKWGEGQREGRVQLTVPLSGFWKEGRDGGRGNKQGKEKYCVLVSKDRCTSVKDA